MRRILLATTLLAFSFGCATTKTAEGAAPAREAEVSDAWRAQPPQPGEPAELVTPTFEKKVLENGLTILVSERHDLPLVSVNVAFSAGAAVDPAGRAGLAEVTYETLLEGAGKLDALALDEAFADLGTAPYVSVGQDGAMVGTQVLTRNLDAATALLADIVLAPQFREASFERRKQQQLADLALQVGNPRYLASETFAEVAFGETHPYGKLASGTPATVGKLTLADAKAFWKKHAGPKAAAFIATGDITMEEAEALARKYFGAWKGTAQPVAKPGPPASTAREHITFVAKPGLNQTMIIMGRPAVEAGNPDEYALELASSIFGGFFGSRLNMNLREARGYTYGARAYVDGRRGVGPLIASSSVRADVTGPALQEFINELQGIEQRPITDEELEQAREGVIRSIPGSFESVSGLAGAAASLFWKDRPLDHYEQMIDALEGLELAAVQAAAEKYFDPAQMHIVLVGDPQVIQQQVEPLGLGALRERNPVAPTAAK